MPYTRLGVTNATTSRPDCGSASTPALTTDDWTVPSARRVAVAVTIDDLERTAARGWRAVEEEALGSWLLRAADGFTGRANSTLAVGDPGGPLPAAVEAVRRWYARRGLPAVIAVPYPTGRAENSDLDRLLATLGWTIRADAAVVMTADPAEVASRGDGTAGLVDIDDEPDTGWLSCYHYRSRDLPRVARTVLTSAPWQAFASVRSQDETIAIGRVAGSDGWGGLTAIEVDPGHRRRGLATAVTAALAACAAEHGMTGLYLQVSCDNEPARALYRKLGFGDHHDYHYRVAPA